MVQWREDDTKWSWIYLIKRVQKSDSMYIFTYMDVHAMMCAKKMCWMFSIVSWTHSDGAYCDFEWSHLIHNECLLFKLVDSNMNTGFTEISTSLFKCVCVTIVYFKNKMIDLFSSTLDYSQSPVCTVMIAIHDSLTTLVLVIQLMENKIECWNKQAEYRNTYEHRNMSTSEWIVFIQLIMKCDTWRVLATRNEYVINHSVT